MKLAMATLAAMALVAVGGTRGEPAPGPQGPGPDLSGYVWDGACKDCHGDLYEAWQRTKHATALNRLTSSERQRECVGCHVTGSTRPIEVDGKLANANVQCESCHGPGRAHVEAAKAGGPGKGNIVRKPAKETCEACHNAKSPHFRGFFYDAMLGFAHRTRTGVAGRPAAGIPAATGHFSPASDREGIDAALLGCPPGLACPMLQART